MQRGLSYLTYCYPFYLYILWCIPVRQSPPKAYIDCLEPLQLNHPHHNLLVGLYSTAICQICFCSTNVALLNHTVGEKKGSKRLSTQHPNTLVPFSKRCKDCYISITTKFSSLCFAPAYALTSTLRKYTKRAENGCLDQVFLIFSSRPIHRTTV